MDWSNEDYVKVYTRETDDDLMLSWQALALWRAMLLKFDRSGLLETRRGIRGLAALVRMPADVVSTALPELLEDGRLEAVPAGYFAPNFLAAQEASKSDRQRQRESRERRAANARVTNRDQTSQVVTDGHESSQVVTLTSADPLLPLLPDQNSPSARDPAVPSGPDVGALVVTRAELQVEIEQRAASGSAVPRLAPAAPILPDAIARAEAKRNLLGWAWQLGGDAFRELGREGIEPGAFDPWAGMPSAGDEGMKLLIAHVDRLLIGEPPDVERARQVFQRRIAVAKAEGRTASPPTRRWVTPMRLWNAESFAKGAEMSPEQVRPRPPPRGSAERAHHPDPPRAALKPM